MFDWLKQISIFFKRENLIRTPLYTAGDLDYTKREHPNENADVENKNPTNSTLVP